MKLKGIDGGPHKRWSMWFNSMQVWNPEQTAGDKPEEGEDDVKSSCPLCPGRHTCYNGRDKGSRSRKGELTLKPILSSDCRLQLACMKPESLVIAGQPYGGEFVPGPYTHRPSHYGSWPCPKSLP
ncbi:hypothetical protein IEQ34_017361 [Dendrobium chrysotoxum]|uniref:Uncharacterized protein n=1 Tax=Dendrobium chrysotoxum TaxID=161865 RepID=A0AAV7GB70_DENCH|nr:hypothetical protein IEQ34_017361 [Dendrobium chrysotoxum]